MMNNIKIELENKKDIISNATIKLDRASTLIYHLIEEYSFNENPDSILAANYWNGTDESIQAKQSATWVHDYETIHQFMEIVADYVRDTNIMLREALKSKPVEEPIKDTMEISNLSARESYIQELKRRDIDPTDENINKLVEELEQTISRLKK